MVCGIGQTAAVGQSPVITIALAQDQIATIKTARGITTRLVFAEHVQEVICGDLYDPASGVGAFVIQRVGSDLFLKPVASEGVSNLFVKTGDNKTGDNSEWTYCFDLAIGPTQQAFRIVRVVRMPVAEEMRPRENTGRTIAIPWTINATDLLYPVSRDIPPALPQTVIVRQIAPPPPPLPRVTAVLELGSGRAAGLKRAIQRNAIRTFKPEYPESAKRVGANGEVTIEVLIDEKGDVLSAEALSGHLLLRHTALMAAQLWKFEPVERGDSSKKANATIRFNFHGEQGTVDSALVSSRERTEKDERRH